MRYFFVITFTEQIKQKAVEIGFHKIGIVRAEPLEIESEHLKEWLNQNYHAEMRWMEREPEKRADPKLLFPEAESIIVVALNYYTAARPRRKSRLKERFRAMPGATIITMF